MSYGAVVLVTAAVFGWGALSARLERSYLTAPMVFVAFGVVLHVAAPLSADVETETVKLLTEVTLVWVLFSDASHVDVRELRADAGIYVRLLAVALPLTVLLGWGLAAGMFPEFDVWLALFVGTALAPTDAALSAAVISHPAVPLRIRSIINVESGLNDGIVTPVVVVALAGAAAATGEGGGGAAAAVVELLIGAVVGAGIGLVGGWALGAARRREWSDREFAGAAMLALPVLGYAA